MCYDSLFTVFTPTYNRAHTLPRAYDSLVSQTFRDFEWLVVDDGSADGTKALMSRWTKEAAFPIRYLYQPNQGKHVAYNHAVPKARGALFVTLDSDDGFVPHTLETLRCYWDEIPIDRRSVFSGINALCVDHNGHIIGDAFPYSPWDSDYFTYVYHWKLRGDRLGCYRTSVMREYPFPEPPVRISHIPEGVVWSRIGKRYKTRYINEPLLRVFDTEGSLSRSRYFSKNAYQLMFYSRVILNEHLAFFRYAPLHIIRAAVNYIRFSRHLSETVLRQISLLDHIGGRIAALLVVPVATVVYHEDKKSAVTGTRGCFIVAAKRMLFIWRRGRRSRRHSRRTAPRGSGRAGRPG